MAAFSPLSLDSILTHQHQHHHHHHHVLFSCPRRFHSPILPKSSLSRSSSFHHHHPFLSLQTSNSQPKSIPPNTNSFPTTPPPSPTPVTTTTSSFLDPDSIRKLQCLENFTYIHEFDHGSLRIRLMAPEEVDETVLLLSESFAESMWMPKEYVSLLAFLVKQYVMEKRSVLPHAATVVGFYKGKGEEEEKLACTVEISFDVLGTNASPHTPLPPRECPYICNMAVSKGLRRLFNLKMGKRTLVIDHINVIVTQLECMGITFDDEERDRLASPTGVRVSDIPTECKTGSVPSLQSYRSGTIKHVQESWLSNCKEG